MDAIMAMLKDTASRKRSGRPQVQFCLEFCAPELRSRAPVETVARFACTTPVDANCIRCAAIAALPVILVLDKTKVRPCD